jgi:hypothetical protein
MARAISPETVAQVKNVSVYDLAARMGNPPKNAQSSWVIFCPNPNHGSEKSPDTYIRKRDGVFQCFGGGGCGCKGGDAIMYYSWSQFGEWDKKHFIESVTGIAEIMDIPVIYQDGSSHNGGDERKPFVPIQPRAIIQDVEAQSDEVCDSVYRRFLSLCPLYEEHVQEWRTKRQYSDEEIVAIGLRSIPKEFSDITSIIRTLISEGYKLERVPGFTQRLRSNRDPKNEKNWYWTIGAGGKYFIPVRNEFGQISRLRVSTGRTDKKYTWFSSAPNIEFEPDVKKMRKGGASSGAPLIVVPPNKVLAQWDPGTPITDYFRSDFVVVTEGEHKSYISATRLKQLLIGMPGVGNYKDVIPMLRRWGTKKVAIAVDMDALLAKNKAAGKNKNVFDHLTEFAKQVLEEEGIEVVIWCWDVKYGKGLDDTLLNSKLPVEIDLRTKERRPVLVAS